MKELELTNAEFEQIKFIDNAIKNLKTPAQEFKIEEAEYKKRLKKREKEMIKSLERVKNSSKYVFINHLTRFVKESDITEEMKSKEIENGFNYLI